VNESATVLVVDDTPQNVKLLTDLLALNGYRVEAAQSGEEALAKIAASVPDIVLLDVMMPGLSGYDVCRKIRQTPATALLPVVMVTSLDPQTERVHGIEAGADDFLAKPINRPELFARVKSLLRVKSLQDEVKRQAEQLAEWNSRLETRVAEQVSQIERMGRLKGFFSPQIAELIVSGGGAHNPLILAQLEAALPEIQVLRSSHLGIPEDAKEGFAFALLAYESFHRRPSNLPSATGARGPAILGNISYAPPR